MHEVGVLAQAVARALDLDHNGMVQEPVEERRGDAGIPEHLPPLRKAAIGGQDQGALLVAGARSSFILGRLLAVTSNLWRGRALQAPFPALATPRPERTVFAATDPVPQRLPRQVLGPYHLPKARPARHERAGAVET